MKETKAMVDLEIVSEEDELLLIVEKTNVVIKCFNTDP